MSLLWSYVNRFSESPIYNGKVYSWSDAVSDENSICWCIHTSSLSFILRGWVFVDDTLLVVTVVSQKFLMIFSPYCVHIDSGWNCTPHIGNVLCVNAMTRPVKSVKLTWYSRTHRPPWWQSRSDRSHFSALQSRSGICIWCHVECLQRPLRRTSRH